MIAAAVPDGARYAVSFVVPAVATLLLTPVAARLAHRLGALDRPGDHKTHGAATPYLGGAAVASGLLVIGAFATGADGELVTILAGALTLAAVGLIDDVRTVPPSVRIAIEAAAGVSLWFVGARAGVLQTPWVDLPLTVLWVVAVVNAFNFVDNMDGLAAGVAAASALGIGSIAALEDDYLVASFAFAVAGASVGFLRYNLPPARIFLGDAGSMLLGFLIAALTLKLDLQVQPTAARLLAVVLLAGVPLFDLSLVVCARMLGRRPVWVGGADHTSHRLAEGGHGQMRIAATFAGAQVACSVLAIWVYQRSAAAALVTAAIVGVAWLSLLVALLRLPHPTPAVRAPADA